MEEFGYPNWVVWFAGLIVFAMGAVVIYAAMTFVNLNVYFNEWGSLGRALYVVLVAYWGKNVLKWTNELDVEQK